MATPSARLPALEVTVTDGTSPLEGRKVYCEIPGRTGGKETLGPITTSADGVARFDPPPGLTAADLPDGVKIRVGKYEKKIEWQPWYKFLIPPPWWKRLWNWICDHVPNTLKGWAAAALVAIAGAYVVVCGVSATAFGRDPFGYNARCARMTVEAAAAQSKPALVLPQGYEAASMPVPLEADASQLFANQVHVTFTSDSRRAVPSAGNPGSADGFAYNEAWTKYEDALRRAAAQGKIPIALQCPKQELAAIFEFVKSLSGKDEKP